MYVGWGLARGGIGSRQAQLHLLPLQSHEVRVRVKGTLVLHLALFLGGDTWGRGPAVSWKPTARSLV